MPRIYSRYRSAELRQLFKNCQGDRKILQNILDELKLRHRPKAVALRKEVEDRLKSVIDGATNKRLSSDRREAKESEVMEEAGAAKTARTDKKARNGAYPRTGSDHPIQEVEQAFSHEFHLVEPIGKAVGHPPKRVFPLKDDVTLQLPPASPLSKRYVEALRLLIAEMKRKGAGLRSILLENGNAVNVDGGQKAYQFEHDGTVDLFEGAAVVARIGSTKSSGFIVAVMQTSLIVSLKDDFGNQISVCVLSVDNTAMIDALAKRLDNLNEDDAAGFNSVLARAIVTNDLPANRRPTQTRVETTSQLNKGQQAAVREAMENDISYIWGPPGTGKTRSLTELTRILFEKEKRILICSNTNQAVDQVLLQLCESLGSYHPAVKNGSIIRIGRIANERLDQEWSSYVTVSGIVDRKSGDLRERLKELETRVGPVREMVVAIDRLFAVLDKVDAARREEKLLTAQEQAAQESLQRADQAVHALAERLASLQDELAKLQGAGLLRRVLMRSEKAILQDHQRVTEQKAHTEAQVKSATRGVIEAREAARKVFDRIAELEKRVPAGAGSRKELKSRRAEFERKLQPLLGEIAAINDKLADMEATVVREARIIGATVTKTYLSPTHFAGFHIVIIDEASMVILPALYYAAGLASEKVVISGDVRQLPPIVESDQRVVLQTIGRDVFEATGITDALENGDSPQRLLMLDIQYRMQEPICELISSAMYHGRLRTERHDVAFGERPPKPFDQALTVVDTSRIWPFVNRDAFGSHYNLMHALAIRNLCVHLHEHGFVSGPRDLGVATPYAAQAKLLRRVLKSSGLERIIAAGTVHRYQGDEKRLMILDIPDSLGEAAVGIFLEADNPHDRGAPLFTVGISRAKDHLVVFANLTYLQEKLPDRALLRDVLNSMQTRGQIVDVRDVIALHPVLDDLKDVQGHVGLELKLEETGLFGQKAFDAICRIDIGNAKESVAVFSGFVTPQRVATYSDLFRRKRAEGITIRCVTRPPHANGSVPRADGKQALDALQSLGCIVDARWSIHEKIVIIDDRIVWFGSLNMLSHTARTDEMMMRIDSADVAEQVALFMTLKRGSSGETGKGLSTRKENPECPKCKARTYYAKGRYGPFWACEECDWKTSVDKPRRPSKTASTGPVSGQGQATGVPRCPKCGVPMVRKKGSFGAFYGCLNYPSCRETRSVETVARRQRRSARANSRIGKRTHV